MSDDGAYTISKTQGPDLSQFSTTSLPDLPHGRIRVSFSGGRTSALMTALILREYRDVRGLDVCVTFANTGQEHERTLEFVRQCDEMWGFGVVWLEAVVQPPKGKSTLHKVVSYESAARQGQPYEEVCAKYGISNRIRQYCTRELKQRPMDSYTKRVLGWKPHTYHTAVGIRADEMDRVSDRALAAGFIYPLVGLGVTKDLVLEWFRAQPFDLGIPEHWGNCTWCWKKSDRKLFTLAKEDPSIFQFPAKLEERYRHAGAGAEAGQVFFRQRRSALDMLQAAKAFEGPLFTDPNWEYDEAFDIGAACGDSCEVGADESFDTTEEETP